MARNLIVENDRAWYLRVRFPDPLTGKIRERKEPLGILGPPTDATKALVMKIADLAALEGEARRREGRPNKPERCQRCDGAMVIHGAPAGAVAVGGAMVAGAAPVAAADLPPPSEFLDAYVEHLRRGHEDGSVTNIEANLRRLIREVGDRWVGGMDGAGAWLATATNTRTGPSGKPLPLKESTRDKIRTFINGLISWAQEAGDPWSRIPLTPLRKKRETVRQKHEHGGVGDDLTEPLSLETLRAILALTEDRTNWLPEYMRLGVQICALTGLSGVDAHGLLMRSDRLALRTDDKGVMWLDGARKKSAVALHAPVAPWLAERLTAFFSRKISVGELDTWAWHWSKIEDALHIPHLPLQGIKRLRVTFNVVVENHIGVPVAVAKALMGHRIKGGDAHNAYTKPTDDLLVKAVLAFERVVFGG